MPGDLTPRWDFETALAFARELERLGAYWLEEPLATEDVEGYARAGSRGRPQDRGRGVRALDGRGSRPRPTRRRRRRPDGRRARRRDRRRAARRGGRRGGGELVEPAHVVERIRPARQPARSSRVLDVPVPRGSVRPARVVGRAARLAPPRHARDRRGRDDRRRPTAPVSASSRTGTRSSGTGSADARFAPPSSTSPGSHSWSRRSSSRRRETTRSSYASPRRVCATRTCVWRTASSARVAGRWCWATRGQGSSRRSARRSTHVAPGDHVGFCIVPACRACDECARRALPPVPAGRRERAARGRCMDGTSRLVASGRDTAPARADDRLLRRATRSWPPQAPSRFRPSFRSGRHRFSAAAS